MKTRILVVFLVLSLMSLWVGTALAKTTLLVWWTIRSPAVMDFTREQVGIFEAEHPDIDIEFVALPEDALQQKLIGAVRADIGPNVIYIDTNFIMLFYNAGILKPVPESVYSEEEIIRDYGPGVVRYKLGDKFYGIPDGRMAALLFYNPEILAEYGYSPLDIPDTWDEFLPMAQTMTDLSQDLQGFPIRGRESSMWNALLFQKGGYIFENKHEAMFASKEGAEAFQFLFDIYDKYKASSRTSLSANEAFMQGKAPFVYNWTWFIGTLQGADVPFETRILPTFTGGPPYGSYGAGASMYVSNTDAKKEKASWEFWKFLNSPGFKYGWALLRGFAPALLELQEHETFKKSPYRALVKAAKYGVEYDLYPDEIGKILLGTMVDKIMEGAPIAETMQEAQDEINEIMETRWQDCIIFGKEWYDVHKNW